MTLSAHSEPWLQHAACRGSNPDLFFPPRGSNIQMAQAKRICSTCPVIQNCLEYALQLGLTHGVFGGTSERERRRMRSTIYRTTSIPS